MTVTDQGVAAAAWTPPATRRGEVRATVYVGNGPGCLVGWTDPRYDDDGLAGYGAAPTARTLNPFVL